MKVDLMLDLETRGTTPGCVVLSIGACSFDMEHQFYEKISVEDSIGMGFTSSKETDEWWLKQDQIVRDEAHSGVKSVMAVLHEFNAFCERLPGPFYIWGNGSDFDLPILAAQYDKLNLRLPWNPFHGRCYRTLKNLFLDVGLERFPGDKHNALDDAKSQANHANEILKAWRLYCDLKNLFLDVGLERFPGDKHNALDDAKHANEILKAWRSYCDNAQARKDA